MEKVRIFSGRPYQLEERINEWLKEDKRTTITIIRVLQSPGNHLLATPSDSSDRETVVITIFYRERKENEPSFPPSN